jgi:hypothetical protein
LSEYDDDPAAFRRQFDPSAVATELSPVQLDKLRKLKEGAVRDEVATTPAELRKRGYEFAEIKKRDTRARAQFGAALDKALQEATEAKGSKLNATEQQEVLNKEVYQWKTRVYREDTGFMGFGRDETRLDEALENGTFTNSKGKRWSEADVMGMVRYMQEQDIDLSIENIQRQLDNAEKYDTGG